ncbi:MAG: 4-alpha-glucanotransferase, partial [Acidimicrobiales bacterium]
LGAHGEDSAGGEDRTRSADPAGGAGRARPPGSGADSPVWVVRAGQPVDAAGEWELVLEDGAALRGAGRLPPDVPLGYHDLRRGDGEPLRLIVTPGRCHLPDGLRTWGWAVQLYAMRSAASWGIGDLGDLAALTAWAAGLGAGMTLLNPLHAALPGPSQEASPYYPSSRCWRNPLYLRVEDVPGAAGHPEMEALAAAGRALDRDRRIDRDAVWRLKRQALEWAWDRFEDDGNFEKWRQCAGPALAGYARFAALTELHEGPWPSWPEGVRHPRGAGVDAAAGRSRRRVGFHEWLQWLVDRQLERAGRPLDLVADLAVGVDPEGADAWLWQDCFALGARVGAPPDEFNVDGQDWGLPPFDPWRLRAARFEPFVQTVRAGLRHAGGLRVDHVMGLSRLWWIPPGARASDGVYVRYPLAELLDVLALESVRAQAFVVGEDLGTVEPAVRRELGERGVLSYRLLWFEPEPPGPAWPRQSLGAVTTHDLPTVAGLWTGADLAEQAALGLHPAGAGAAAIRDRVEGWLGLPDGASPAEVTVAVHRLLAGAPSMVLAATLDDALGVAERPNVPGTTAGLRPNWCLALPASLEEIMSDPVVAEVAHALRRTPGPP